MNQSLRYSVIISALTYHSFGAFRTSWDSVYRWSVMPTSGTVHLPH